MPASLPDPEPSVEIGEEEQVNVITTADFPLDSTEVFIVNQRFSRVPPLSNYPLLRKLCMRQNLLVSVDETWARYDMFAWNLLYIRQLTNH